ncbi:MAG: hypothetical protein J6N67_03860 [Desulfovibrio sp.]|nr:hypothetical protein [Desulfovibrio sp.]
MSDTSRKVFPVETVLALVMGKEGADIKEIAGYVAGRSVPCDCCAKAVGPFAAAWLARWYPKFAELTWVEGQSWDAFVSTGRSILGDNVSLTAMDGLTKTLCGKALDAMSETRDSLTAQTAANAALEARVRELEPAEARAAALDKKVGELEDKIKAMNADMGGLRRQIAEFQGKVAISHDELMETIKDAIKDGLKGMVVGGAAAGAAAAADGGEAAAAAPEENAVPDDFGFGSSGANSDGFGF